MTQNYDKRDNTSPESSDRREDVVETEDAEDETELIFQNYLRRQSGFRRTTPSQQTEPFKRKDFHCDQCDFTSNTLQCLRDHIHFVILMVSVEKKNVCTLTNNLF